MDIECQLLFLVLAAQLELIDPIQLADVCAAWAARRDKPLPMILRERGWLSDEDRRDVERLLDRKLRKHGGDSRAGLQASIDRKLCEAILQLDDAEFRRSLDGFLSTDPSPDGPPLRAAEGTPASPAPTIDFISSPRRFETMALHGVGGLGMVWRSRDNDLNRDVALKRLKPERRRHPEALGGFSREAQITGQLQHPNIVPVYDLGRDPVEHDPFYIMKLVHGRTLHQAIAELHRTAGGGRPDATVRRRLLGAIVQVAQAVAFAHARGVLHLDLTPGNIMLGAFGEVIVLDWGLARLRSADVEPAVPADPRAPTVEAIVLSGEALATGTTAGRVQGTREYMAPEQAEGTTGRFDERTDVFGLGAILFEVLTGRAPRTFDREPLGIALQRIRTEPIVRPQAIAPHVPAALDEVCARSLALDPARRLAGAGAFLAALETWLADEPLIACREIVAGFEKMTAKHPEVLDYCEQLARSRANLGLVLDGLGRHQEAEAAYRAAIAEYEAIVAAHPLLPGPRADMAATRTHLGRALDVLGRRDEAEAARNAALADYTALATAHPPARDYTTGLASVYLTMSLGPPPAARRSQTPDDSTPSVHATEEAASPGQASRTPRMSETGSFDTGAAATEPPHLGDRGRLEIRNVMGTGGVGTVYLAHDHDLNRDVAVKILASSEAGSEPQRRFLREAQITAQLEHPHIIPVYGLGFRSQDGVPFLTMRLVRGSSMTQAIDDYHRRRGADGLDTVQLGRLLRWMVQVCNALAYAHRRGVIHRDVKPSNILIGPSDEAFLADWGLARVIAQPGTSPLDLSITIPPALEGSVIGTPAYMAPEQARGLEDQIDARTDIYAMGSSLFQVLTGRAPFRPMDLGGIHEVIEAIQAGPTPHARAVDRSVPAELDAICARAMAHEPADRYVTALDLKRDLEGWLYGGPIAAFPESSPRRAWRRLRHDRA